MPSYKQQIPEAPLQAWPPGIYEVEIISAEEKTSRAGNDMIVLKVQVLQDGETKGGKIMEHLVFSPKAVWKVDQVRQALGETIVPDEEVEVEADDFIAKRGKVALIIDEDDARWNRIDYWIAPDDAKPAKPPIDADDDDIPF
jgi:hypothetical protein